MVASEKENNQNRPRPLLSVWMPLLLSVFLVGGIWIGLRMKRTAPITVIQEESSSSATLGRGKIEELIRYIEAKYVDEVDRDKLIDKAINSILENLDPHSAYISSEQLENINEQLEGDFDGIGVEFLVVEDTIVVINPLEGGPAETVGILPGDKIVSVSDTVVAGQNMDTNKVMAMLRGKTGTTVNIGVLRGKEKQLRHFEVARDKIPINSVDAAYKLNDQTVYVKISRFSAKTYKEFLGALDNIAEEGEKLNLIIDLRNNNGGYLQQATNILNQIIKERDQLLVYTNGRTVKRTDYETTGPVYYDFDEICVLINEGSASASEILAGVVQDYDRGTIIGRRSFGKGLVQEQYRLSDGSALRLTVARYYMPSGRSIQRPYDDLQAYQEDVIARYETGELYSERKIPIQDSTSYFTASGREVFASNGIIPDIFVPLDSIYTEEDYLILQPYVPEFVFRHMEENEQAYNYSLEEFTRDFSVGPALLNSFLAFANAKGQTLSQLKPEVRDALSLLIKARMGKHLFKETGFYKVLNQQDEMVSKAVNVIKEKQVTEKMKF